MMLPWNDDASPELLASVRDTSLAELVRGAVLGLILSGELAPGQRINEPDIAARLKVSRVPVREALRQLESSGLVQSRKHAGVFVRVLEERDVADLYDLRSVLDGHAGRRAAGLPAAPRNALARRLGTALREMRALAKRRDVPAYYAANLQFHWSIVEAAGNEQLARTYRGVVQQLHLARLRNLSQDYGLQVSQEEHEQILAALADGDAERCQALQTAHVTASHGRLVQMLDRA